MGRRLIGRLALSTIGLVFPTAMVIGYFVGRFFGGLLGAAETGGWIGGALGLVSGFYNVYKVAMKLGNEDEAATGESEDPEG